jgi:hypothetical protein
VACSISAKPLAPPAEVGAMVAALGGKKLARAWAKLAAWGVDQGPAVAVAGDRKATPYAAVELELVRLAAA